MVQSLKFDGKVPNWYHTDCFFKKVKLIDVKIMKGFDDLRWEDQDKIHENDPNNTFTVEYAKSNRSTCHGCDTSIDKDTLRLSRKNYTSKRSRRYGSTDEWYHVDCFNHMKKDLGFFGNAELFFGFVDLNNEDQVELKEKFGTSTSSKQKRKGVRINDESTKEKQAKIEDTTLETLNEQEETRLKKEQCELLWTYKDNLRKEIPNDVLKELLEFNAQKPVSGESNLIDAVTDYMAFGALEPCPNVMVFLFSIIQIIVVQATLPNGQNVLIEHNYLNEDHLKCQIKSKKPTTCFEIKEPDYDPKLPLNDYSVALVGRLSKRTSTLQKQIEQLGATIVSTIDKTVDVIISTQDEVQKGNKRIQNAQTFEIHIVPEQFLDDIVNDRPSIVMEKLKLSTWGILPHIRKQQTHEKKKIKRKSSNTFKSVGRSKQFIPGKVTMKLNDGVAVDPDSGLEETCHVLKDSKTGGIFTAVLGMVDITRDTNSYYKIQLLEDDNGKKWFLFRA
ncbi:unnamed protein product [Rotaria sordida]|uniref:NAD(+) ADP-ribosyltransferase n=1 Tax=Rotaria sordida TaxID=392033 RepID=A0A814TCF5_9BILA|nr:unnamed protein product [Rotaria sordida]CAF1160194.1 unnamed protein product [Rotaria sordida]